MAVVEGNLFLQKLSEKLSSIICLLGLSNQRYFLVLIIDSIYWIRKVPKRIISAASNLHRMDLLFDQGEILNDKLYLLSAQKLPTNNHLEHLLLYHLMGQKYAVVFPLDQNCC